MCAGEGSLRIKGFEQFTKADGLVFSSMRHCGDTCRPFALVKFTWNGDMPYNGVEWGLTFPVRAICLHRERDSAPQVPVEGLSVPGEFHGRWNRWTNVIFGYPIQPECQRYPDSRAASAAVAERQQDFL